MTYWGRLPLLDTCYTILYTHTHAYDLQLFDQTT